MAGNVKGITIEFRGETTKLDKALKQINNETKAIDRELKQVDRALKFNPTNVDLWRQKQQLLTQKISETKEKLSLLEAEQKRLDAANVDKNSEEYRKLQREIIETQSQVKHFESQLRKVGNVNLRATSEQFKEIGNKLTAAGQAMRGVSLAGAAVVGVLSTMTYKAASAADKLNTLSKVTGVNTKDLQKYALVSEQVDVSVTAIAKSHTKLKKSMLSAQDGSGSMAEAFGKLGISVTNTDGTLRDADTVWQETIAALGKMENETERDAIAMQLMGKSASELNPLIEDGGETYKRVAELFEKYNLELVDQETLDKANEFKDSLDDIKSMGTLAFEMLGARLAEYLLPIMGKVVDAVGRFVGWLANLNPKVLAVVGAIAGVVAVIAPLLLVIGKVAFAISSIMGLMATLGLSIGALAAPIGIVIAVIIAVIAAFVLWKKYGDKAKKWIADLGKSIKATFDDIKKSITKTWNDVKSFLSKVWDAIKTAAKVAWEAVKAATMGPLYIMFQLIRSNWDSIKAFLISTWNSIKSTASSVWNSIKSVITSPIQSLASSLSSIWDSIRSTASSAFSSVYSTASSTWNSIKNAIISPLNSAYSTAASVMRRLRSLFPVSIGRLLSNISLPHFSLSWSSKSFGKLGTVRYPTGLHVSWYDKGGIFTNPTIIGVGEKRPEFVGALDDLREIVREEAGGFGEGVVINVYPSASMDENALARKIEQKLVELQKQRQRAYGTI